MPNLKHKYFKHVITKWSDNGGVNTEEEIHNYIQSYKEKAGREFLYSIFLDQSKTCFLDLYQKILMIIYTSFLKKFT